MLVFARNKIVNIEYKDGKGFIVRAIFDDSAHNMEMVVEIENLVIKSIEGDMKRVPYNYCKKALLRLKEAIGYRIEPGLTLKVDENIGRRGCPHLANLLLECCHALIEGGIAKYIDLRDIDIKRAERLWLQDIPLIKGGCVVYSDNEK
jgi:hypothetical protein